MGHDAFISYSHAVDSKLATAVETGLEKLTKPLLKLRAMEVFRDETSLAVNPELWAGIVGHLSASRWLLVLACPESASSYYCNKEVLCWLENRGPQQMLILLGVANWRGTNKPRTSTGPGRPRCRASFRGN